MADLFKIDGTKSSIDLDQTVFGVQVNMPVLHQVVTAQLAARRSGSSSTKTRAQVKATSRKMYRQKGTGGARHGAQSAPIFSGGGVAHGPHPRSYAQKTPKKMIRLALCSALSDRANDGRVFVVDSWSGWTEPKTKRASEFLQSIGATGKTLVVLDEGTQDDYNAYVSFRNLTDVHAMVSAELNAYDVLNADTVVFSKSCVPTTEAWNNRSQDVEVTE